MSGPASAAAGRPDATLVPRAAGTCFVLIALDVAREIPLAAAEVRLAAAVQPPALPRHKHRTALGAGPLTPPLRLVLPCESEAIGAFRTAGAVELALYDFGAVAVGWRIEFEASAEELVQLAVALYANETLMRSAQAIASSVLERLADVARGPGLAAEVEDYVLFHLPGGDADLPAPQDLARLLRAEPGPLSGEEVQNALANRIRYRDGESCHVDWLGAVLAGADMEDERQLLEVATVELLELRFLDGQLGRGVEQAYGALSRTRRLGGLAVRSRELQRLARLEADNATLHEGIEHASKQLGDDYLARLHRTAADRFHFAEWDASIERKLRVLNAIYGQVSDVAWRRRSEILEWIIILLIAADLLLFLTPLR